MKQAVKAAKEYLQSQAFSFSGMVEQFTKRKHGKEPIKYLHPALETILGDMPGLLKRVSVTFYTRCLMFDAAAEYGLSPERPTVYQPVDGATAWAVLVGGTVCLLLAGMWWFSRTEYRDDG